MTISNLQIVEALAEKKLSEIIELISLIEEKFGVSAAALVQAAAPAEASAPVEEKTEFDVVLKGVDDSSKRMGVIRTMHALSDNELGLKPAKELVEKAPVTLKTAVSKEVAEDYRAKLTAAGATIEIVATVFEEKA